MNKKYTLGLLLLFLVNVVHAQKVSSFTLGVNQTAYKLLDTDGFSNISASPNISLGYNLGKFSLNTEVGQMNFKASRFFEDYSSLVDRLGTFSGTDKWKGNYFLAGPGYNFIRTQNFSFGLKVLTGLYQPKSAANYEITDNVLSNLTYERLQGFLGEKKSFLTVKGGLDLEYYPKSKPFGFRLATGYTALNTEENLRIARFGKDFSKYTLGPDQPDEIIREILLSTPNIEETSIPNFNNIYATLGLIYRIGGKDKSIKNKIPKTQTPKTSQGLEVNKKTKPRTEETDINCLKTTLKSPSNGEKYLSNSSIKPQFTWINLSNSELNYEFKLFENDKLVYTKKTTSNSVDTDNQLEKIFNSQRAGEKQYHWMVKTTCPDCPDQISEKQNFSIRSSNNIEMNITEIACLYPAYDSLGNVKYKAKVEFKTGNNSNPWQINSLSLIESGRNIPINTLTNCGNGNMGFTPVAPLVLGPNSSPSVWCFEFSVPIGSSNQTFQTNGALGNGSGNVSTQNSLPSCICNVCDIKNPIGWQAVTSDKTFRKFNYNGGKSNMRIGTNFQIQNADPIQKVQAEIVSVQHIVNDTLCYSCTKNDDTMGLFYKEPSSGIINSKNGWQNNGAATLFDENNDNYGNKFTWLSSTSDGVDFSTNKQFNMNLNLPPISTLECCKTKYSVCVRYTFEDINCQSCDYLVCYEYDSSTASTEGELGDEGVDQEIRNQSGGILTPNQLTPKK